MCSFNKQLTYLGHRYVASKRILYKSVFEGQIWPQEKLPRNKNWSGAETQERLRNFSFLLTQTILHVAYVTTH